MKLGVNIYVPGILTVPGDADNWSGRAVTRTHNVTERRAEKVEYFSSVLTRPLFQRTRAEKLARTIDYYFDWDRRLIGHSNGCDVILDALKLRGWPRVEELHLVCAACEADFNKNGLNEAILSRCVGRVFVYIAEKDQALRWARTLPGKLFGFGTLGLSGPVNEAPETNDRVAQLEWPNLGHSDCWSDKLFERTMRHFLHA